MMEVIPLRGVRVHNLQGIDVAVPLRKMTVVTGVSGAGKSSLVFDTLFAESQRRYLQSFSPYVRQFLERFDKPDAEYIGELPPAIALGRRVLPRNSLATVGSLTEIEDYLGLLFARRGVATCQKCGRVVKAYAPADVVTEAVALPTGSQVSVAFLFQVDPEVDSKTWEAELREEGFVRVRIGEKVFRLGEGEISELGAGHDRNRNPPKVWVLVDRLETGKTTPQRWFDSIETAFARGQGRLALFTDAGDRFYDRRLVCPYCDGDPGLTVRLAGRTGEELSGLSLVDLDGFITGSNSPPLYSRGAGSEGEFASDGPPHPNPNPSPPSTGERGFRIKLTYRNKR